MASSWVAMAFAAYLSATDARGMCSGLVFSGILIKTRRRVVFRTHLI